MELDSRIKEDKRPLTCIDVEQAEEFVGKLCLFSDDYRNYKDIQEYSENPQYIGTLAPQDNVNLQEYPFKNENDGGSYRLVLPLDWVKEPKKKYRPFTLAEWIEQHEIGDIIHYRSKYGTELRHMYLGTRHRTEYKMLTLGGESHTLDYLFENYEIEINGEWLPFGVIDEDKE